MKTVTYQGKKKELTPIKLLSGGPVAREVAQGAEAYVTDDDAVLVLDGKKISHYFPPGTPNRNELSFEALA